MREWLDALEDRTKQFAIRVLKLSRQLEKLDVPKTVVWQLVDSGTSVAANHRACRRARSTRELIAKLGLVLEEADETNLWLELIQAVVEDDAVLKESKAVEQEAAELTAIFNKSVATSRRKLDQSRQGARR